MNKDIKTILSQNKHVADVHVSNVVKIHTVISCEPQNVDAVRKEIYQLELEVMKKYPHVLLDFSISSKEREENDV